MTTALQNKEYNLVCALDLENDLDQERGQYRGQDDVGQGQGNAQGHAKDQGQGGDAPEAGKKLSIICSQ